MSTARDRAVAAAEELSSLSVPAQYADVVSDIWEPLLREAQAVMNQLILDKVDDERLDRCWAAIKEALG